MKTENLIILIIVLLFFFTLSANKQEIDEKNWLKHPEIMEIRKIYLEIKKNIENGQYLKKERNFEYCTPYEDTSRALFQDDKNIIKCYLSEAGSEDSTIYQESFYDDNKILRFAFITGKAYNGTVIEYRTYFNENGIKIWENQARISGPGYTFPTKWPDSEYVQNPNETFNKKNDCPEMNQGDA